MDKQLVCKVCTQEAVAAMLLPCGCAMGLACAEGAKGGTCPRCGHEAKNLRKIYL